LRQFTAVCFRDHTVQKMPQHRLLIRFARMNQPI
jgi:hypothetical protein